MIRTEFTFIGRAGHSKISYNFHYDANGLEEVCVHEFHNKCVELDASWGYLFDVDGEMVAQYTKEYGLMRETFKELK